MSEQQAGDSPVVVAPPDTFVGRLHPAAFVVLALGVIFLLYQVVAGGAALLIAGGRITPDTVPLVRWSTLLGQVLCLLLPTLVLTRLRYGAILRPLRLRFPSVPELLLTLVALFALQQVLQGYMTLQDSIPLPPKLQHFVDTMKSLFEETYRMLVSANSPSEFVFVIITVALVPAVCEELLFRGLVQRDLESVAGGLGSALLTGFIFGIFHLNPLSLIPLVVLGMFFGVVVHRARNITLSMSAHFLNNALACIAVYAGIRDDFVAVDPSGGGGPGAIAANSALFGGIFLAAMYSFIRITGQRQPG